MPIVKHQPYPPDKPHYEGLTVKQQTFTNEVVRQIKETGELNGKKAAMVAFPNASQPRTMATEYLAKPSVKSAVIISLENAGITDKLLDLKLFQGLDATKFEGKAKVADHGLRLKFVQEANRLKDRYPNQQIEVNKRVANINIDLNVEPEKINKALKTKLSDINELQEEYS